MQSDTDKTGGQHKDPPSTLLLIGLKRQINSKILTRVTECFLCKYVNISFKAIPLSNGVCVLIMDEGFRRHVNYFKKYNEADGNNIVETQNIFNLTCLFS